MNILCVIWWFNPVIWFYMKAVSENHKYLVDREMLNSFGSQEYQYVLVNYRLKVPVFSFANSFSYSNQMRHILLMKKCSSNPVKKLFVVLLVLILAFSFCFFPNLSIFII